MRVTLPGPCPLGSVSRCALVEGLLVKWAEPHHQGLLVFL